MTEDIPSDRHERSPSSAAMDIVKLKERYMQLKEDVSDNRRESANNSHRTSVQYDIIIDKLSKIQSDMIRGDERFKAIEKEQKDTTLAIERVETDLELLKNDKRGNVGVFGAVIGSMSAIAVAVGWGIHFLSGGKVPPPSVP